MLPTISEKFDFVLADNSQHSVLQSNCSDKLRHFVYHQSITYFYHANYMQEELGHQDYLDFDEYLKETHHEFALFKY